MNSEMDTVGVIDASVPDDAIPVMKVEAASGKRRKEARSERFLKGPIPLAWIRKHVQCSVDRLLFTLIAHSDMRKTNEFKITNGILRDAGIMDRKTAYRAVNRLEAAGTIAATRKRGARTVIRLISLPHGH